MTNKYAEALGYMEFEVGGIEYKLEPEQGDSLELAEIQHKYSDNPSKFLQEFVKFVAKVINRQEQIDEKDPAYRQMLTFIELNHTDFMREVYIAFRQTTREKWEANEKRAAEAFLKGLNEE